MFQPALVCAEGQYEVVFHVWESVLINLSGKISVEGRLRWFQGLDVCSVFLLWVDLYIRVIFFCFR